MPHDGSQPALFELPPPALVPAPQRIEHVRVAANLPRGTRLGTMSWSYPAWVNLVYAAEHSQKVLSEAGLTAYAKHPLLRATEIDRSYYDPLPAGDYQRYAAQTPDDFRFVVKAHDACTVHTYPTHARYGKRGGQLNPLYLDAAYAADRVVAPLLEGLGARAFALLFQFPPQEIDERPEAFAEQLCRFLSDLPRVPFAYAVELRNTERFTSHYAEALATAGAIHCHNVWPGVPPILAQARMLPPSTRHPLLVRWLMRRGDSYDAAMARSAPFGRITLEDPDNLAAVSRLMAGAEKHGVPALVTVDNKAEGCGPETIFRLATRLAEVAQGL
jgi:uncharacterized protein YecE (DUF72 family)